MFVGLARSAGPAAPRACTPPAASSVCSVHRQRVGAAAPAARVCAAHRWWTGWPRAARGKGHHPAALARLAKERPLLHALAEHLLQAQGLGAKLHLGGFAGQLAGPALAQLVLHRVGHALHKLHHIGPARKPQPLRPQRQGALHPDPLAQQTLRNVHVLVGVLAAQGELVVLPFALQQNQGRPAGAVGVLGQGAQGQGLLRLGGSRDYLGEYIVEFVHANASATACAYLVRPATPPVAALSRRAGGSYRGSKPSTLAGACGWPRG